MVTEWVIRVPSLGHTCTGTMAVLRSRPVLGDRFGWVDRIRGCYSIGPFAMATLLGCRKDREPSDDTAETRAVSRLGAHSWVATHVGNLNPVSTCGVAALARTRGSVNAGESGNDRG